MAALQAEQLFAVLDRHGVEYVLVGGLAAVLHGSPLPTLDADICPSRTPENLEHLAAALGELDARVRTPDAAGGVSFPHESAFLAGVELLNLVTRVGELDLTFFPSGTTGFDDLVRRAVPMRVHQVTITVAALEDVIRSKEAANRPKDRRSLPMLYLLLEELNRHPRDSFS